MIQLVHEVPILAVVLFFAGAKVVRALASLLRSTGATYAEIRRARAQTAAPLLHAKLVLKMARTSDFEELRRLQHAERLLRSRLPQPAAVALPSADTV